ncbi:MAG: DNA polymerase III subunit delta [Rhizobiaceae bacterium]|nr:DNA polymerase III subunit delta [Rhizobiaceae bacterium]
MAQKKSNEVDAWLARPDPRIPVVLIYGPDHGLVTERARRYAESLRIPLDDPFSVVRLEAAEIEQQPGRLMDEVQTVPMFSDRRLLWVRNAGAQKSLADSVRLLGDTPPRDAMVLIEAGDLKKTAPLRAQVEASAIGMALPCYADDERGLDRLIDDVLGQNGLSIAPDARHLLRRGLGGDRLASRGEIEKLALYAMGSSEVTTSDILAIEGDASGLSVDDAVDAVIGGRVDDFDTVYTRQCQSGAQTFQFLSAAMRQLQALRTLRGQMDEGKTAAGAVTAARPPVFFARRGLVERALGKVSSTDLDEMLRRVYDSILLTRREPALAVASTRQTLLAITLRMARG